MTPEARFASFANGCFQADPNARFDDIRRRFQQRHPLEWAALLAGLMPAPVKAVA